MGKQLTNDENIKNLKKRETLRILIIVFSLITIMLTLANLFYKLNIVFALISFVIVQILNRMRAKTPIIKNDEFASIRKEIEKSKKHKK